MEMTHPDILKMERFGLLDADKPEIIGECAVCGLELDDDHEYLTQNNGEALFCSTECALEYNDIEIRS